MTYKDACIILTAQNNSLRKVNGVRFTEGSYEYRINYEGGFAAFVSVDRRQIGKRNFKGFGAYNCRNAEQVLDIVAEKIKVA